MILLLAEICSEYEKGFVVSMTIKAHSSDIESLTLKGKTCV